MKKGLERELGFFPTDAEFAVVLELGDGCLYRSASAIAPKRATIVCMATIASIASDHSDAFDCNRSMKKQRHKIYRQCLTRSFMR